MSFYNSYPKGSEVVALSREVKYLRVMMKEWKTELDKEKPDTKGVATAIGKYLDSWDTYNLGAHTKYQS